MLLETIRLQNGKLQNVFWHNRRSNHARAALLGIHTPWDLSKKIKVPKSVSSGLWKCRVLYGASDFELDFQPYKPKKIRSVAVVAADDLDYAHKYSDRSQLYALAAQSGADDVLFVKNGLLTDMSYANVVFFDGTKWWTPAVPLLEGTRRAHLLARKRIFPKEIRFLELKDFVGFKPINAMLQFGRTPMLGMDVLDVL